MPVQARGLDLTDMGDHRGRFSAQTRNNRGTSTFSPLPQDDPAIPTSKFMIFLQCGKTASQGRWDTSDAGHVVSVEGRVTI